MGRVFDGNVYMPPDNPEFPIAVVTAFDGKQRTGYAIVEFSEGRQATAGLLTWEAIATFEVEAVGAPRCFANGWQQIMVRVTVAAASDSNNQPIKISDADMATLKFLNLDSNNDLPFLAPMEESLSSDAPGDQGWAVNKEYNNIQRQAGVNSGSSTPLEARTHYFYLHCRRPGKIKVIASIQNTLTGYTVTSRAVGEVGKLELTGQDVPPFAQRAYSFTRTRAIGDSLRPKGMSSPMLIKVLDNWLLEYVEKEGRPIKFARLFISDNKSGVRWSWEPGSSSTPIKDDDFVSYTGFRSGRLMVGSMTGLLFDGRLYRMAKQRGYPLPPLVEGKGPGAGELMITLNRDTGFVRGRVGWKARVIARHLKRT